MALEQFMDTCINGGLEDVMALLPAEAEQDPEVMEALSERDEFQKSVIDKVVMIGKKDVLKYLIQNGFCVNGQSNQGYTPLHHAACWGHIGCLKELYFAGADVKALSIHNETPRDSASRYNQEDALAFLERAEAEVDLKGMAKNFKDIIADPERNLGKFNKEDRITGNRACDEKIDWVENNKGTTSLSQILQMKFDLEEFMKPIMAKLEDSQGKV